MSDIELIRQKHRNMIILHIGKLVYGREPSGNEVREINFMLEIGKTIPELMSSLRALEVKMGGAMDSIGSNLAGCYLASFSEKKQFSFMRTPLEKHFHEYVRS